MKKNATNAIYAAMRKRESVGGVNHVGNHMKFIIITALNVFHTKVAINI